MIGSCGTLRGVANVGKMFFGERETMSDDFPFEIKTLLEQCGGNRDIGGVVLDEFIIQVAADLKELDACVANGNVAQAAKVGHRLKGTAGVLGADSLHTLCAALEIAGKNGSEEEVAKICSELKTETDRCIAAIPEARNRL